MELPRGSERAIPSLPPTPPNIPENRLHSRWDGGRRLFRGYCRPQRRRPQMSLLEPLAYHQRRFNPNPSSLSLSPSRFHISARLFPRLVRPLAFYSLLLLLLLRLRLGLPFEASARARCWKRRATRKRRQRRRRWRLQWFPPSFLPSFLPSFNASISLATAAAPRSPARSVTDVAPAYFLVSEARFLCSSRRRPLNVSGPRVWFIQLSLSLSLCSAPLAALPFSQGSDGQWSGGQCSGQQE